MDLRYLAGFFDGEGSVAVYKNSDKRGYCLKFQLTQNVTPQSALIVDWLKNHYDVSVNVQRTLSGKEKYNVALSGAKAATILRDLQPHVILKKDQIDLALKWHDDKPPRLRDNKGRITAFDEAYFVRSKEVADKLRALKRV